MCILINYTIIRILLENLININLLITVQILSNSPTYTINGGPEINIESDSPISWFTCNNNCEDSWLCCPKKAHPSSQWQLCRVSLQCDCLHVTFDCNQCDSISNMNPFFFSNLNKSRLSLANINLHNIHSRPCYAACNCKKWTLQPLLLDDIISLNMDWRMPRVSRSRPLVYCHDGYTSQWY